MAQLQLKNLLSQANAILERGNNFFGKVLVDKSEMAALIEEINACIPADVREAELIIARKEDIIREGQNRAERIIQDAMNEQARLVSDNEVLRKVQEAAKKQKQQVEEYCENLQNTAAKNAEEIRILAIREAAKIQEGSEDYAEKIFNDMAANIGQILNNVHLCQQALAEQKARHKSPARQSEPEQNQEENDNDEE